MNNQVRERLQKFQSWRKSEKIDYSNKQLAEDLQISFFYLKALLYGNYVVKSRSVIKAFIERIDSIQRDLTTT